MTLQATLADLRSVARPALVVDGEVGSPARVAILPGSFDPVTVAHEALAVAAAVWVEVVVLLYSVRTIAKEAEPALLSEPQRIRQLDSFAGEDPRFVVGLASHGLLVDQVGAARERFPTAELRLVIGSDKLLQLLDPSWYEDPDRALGGLFAEAAVMYAVREGEADDVRRALRANRRWADRLIPLDVHADVAAVSSRSVRARLRRGQDVTDLVPDPVLRSLRAEGVLP